MNTRIVLLFVNEGYASPARPAHPCDIVDTVSLFVIPRIDYAKPARLEEVLNFIYSRYRDVDADPPRETIFTFEYRLPKSTLNHLVTLRASDITMIQAIKQALGDTPIVLGFENGKLVFSEPVKR